MDNIAIITDTVTHMPREIAAKYNIKLLASHVVMDGKSFPEDEINIVEFCDKLPGWKKAGHMPTTTGIPIDTFLKVYQELSQKAKSILYISQTSKISPSPQTALQAIEKVKGKLSQTVFKVIDCGTVCGAEMLIVLEAARAAAAGKSLSEVVEVVNKMIKKINYILLSDNLYYLAHGGRIHRARPWANTKITNTALLEVNAATGGEHIPVARCRTKGQTLKALFDIVKQRSGEKKLHVAIDHADAPAEAEELKQKVLSQFHCAEVFVNQMGALVTLHTGVGTRIFSWWAED
ncbi:MAG: DegV family protein [Dehalococcoidales bacterium]|nr:DegV family protein [Dehalococcoidales bacterium]